MQAHISPPLQTHFFLSLFSSHLSCAVEGFQPGSVSTQALQLPPHVLPWPSPEEHGGEARRRQPANAALFMRAAWWCRLQSGGSWETLSGLKR